MGDLLGDNIYIPFMIEKDGQIKDVSTAFLGLCGLGRDDLIDKPFTTVWGKLLRITVQPNSVDTETEAFLFTKALDARCVTIRVLRNNEASETIYIINEIPGSRFEDKNVHLEQLCKSNFVGVAVYSVSDMILVKANQMYLDFLEPPFNDKRISIGRRIGEIITGWKGSLAEGFWKEAISTEKTVQVKEYEHTGYEKGITYWDAIITPIPEGGEMKYVVSNTYEVTERVLNRKKVQEQIEAINFKNKKLEVIFESIEGNISIFDRKGRYLRKSGDFNKIFEPTDSDVWTTIEKTDFFDLEGNPYPKEELCVPRLMRGRKVKNLRLRLCADGREKYLDISGVPILDENNEFKMGVMFNVDISEIVNMSKQIRQQKKMLEAVIDGLSDYISLIDKNGNFLKKSKVAIENFEAMNNVYDSLNSGNKFYDFNDNIIPAEETHGFKVMRGEQIKDVGLKIVNDGKKKYLIGSTIPIFDDNGELSTGIVIMHDVTDLINSKQALLASQKQLLEAEKEKNETLEKVIEMKDEFLSIISHEFRTPLSVIITAIQAMNYICKDEISDKAKEYIETIKQNTFRQLRLVNNLLDITRVNAGRIKINKKNMDIVFLTKSITESVNTYASQKGVSITFVSSLNKKIIGIDDEKYERILLNLLSNAIKFTPAGKSIVVKLRSAKNTVCIEVKDTGIGIPKDKLDIIFERFGQVDSSLSRQAEGAGIGLSLVKRFVEGLGGSVSVKSKVGKGSTFTILLPNEKVMEECAEGQRANLLDNHIVQTTIVEFSDIYL